MRPQDDQHLQFRRCKAKFKIMERNWSLKKLTESQKCQKKHDCRDDDESEPPAESSNLFSIDPKLKLGVCLVVGKVVL